MIWHYKRYFNCDSKNVIYILMRNTCEWFYLGQTNLIERIRKHKRDVFNSQNSFVRNAKNIYTIVTEWKKTLFRIYPQNDVLPKEAFSS